MKILSIILLMFLPLILSLPQAEADEKIDVFAQSVDDIISRVNHGVVTHGFAQNHDPWGLKLFVLNVQTNFYFDVNAGDTTIKASPEFIFQFERK